MVIAAMKLKDATLWKTSYDQPRQHIKKQRHYFANKGPSSQGCILSPCLFNLYAEYIMRNAGLEESQAESRLAREISITSDMQMTPPLWQKVKRN